MPNVGLGSGLWAYVAPKEAVNLCVNPSYERGTASAVAIEGAGLGSSSATQQFGAWSLFVTPTSNGTSGAVVGTWVATNLQPYSLSAYAKLANGVSYIFGASDTAGGNYDVLGTINVTGGGTWHYYTMSYTELVGGGGRGIILAKRTGASTGTYWVDGIQAELGSVSTYVDGDQPGGTWQGAPHASTTFRSGQYRGGGSVIALADIGLSVDQMLGVGAPPIEVSTQSYAILPGAEFQRQRAGVRQFTLTVKPIVGTSLGDFHVTRRSLFDAFKPDLVAPQQPVRFLYYGAQGTQQLDGYYQSGLDLGNMDGPISEVAALQFAATDPYWYAPTQQGTSLTARSSLGSANFMARRTPLGVWGTVGQTSGTTVQNGITMIYTLAMNQGGTLFMGGEWGTLAGTVAPNIGMYFPQTNLFGTLTGGTSLFGGTVYALEFSPSGTLYIGGWGMNLGGTATNGIGQWNGAFGTLPHGTMDTSGYAKGLLFHPNGTLFMVGSIASFDGTTTRHTAMWSAGVGGTLSGGTIDDAGNALLKGNNNQVYVAGGFQNVAGTVSGRMAQWAGAWGTLSGGTLNNTAFTLALGLDGRINVGGNFTSAGASSMLRTASWNGVAFTAQGDGLNAVVQKVIVDPVDNTLYAGGRFGSTGSRSLYSGLAKFNGNSWVPMDIDIGAGTVFSLLQAPDRTMYISGRFSGAAYAAAIGTIVNVGRAEAHPTLRLRNNTSGTARIYQLANSIANNTIYFDLSLLAGEIAELVLTPGNISFSSNFRQNLLSALLPGSNLATWVLSPGTNYVSFFADNDSLETTLFWQPRGWAIDSGTVL